MKELQAVFDNGPKVGRGARVVGSGFAVGVGELMNWATWDGSTGRTWIGKRLRTLPMMWLRS